MESHSTVTFNDPELVNIYINGKPLSDKYTIEQFDIHMTTRYVMAPSISVPTYDVILNIKPKEINEIDIPDVTIEDLL